MYRFNDSAAAHTRPEQKTEPLSRTTTPRGISLKKALAIDAVPPPSFFGAAFHRVSCFFLIFVVYSAPSTNIAFSANAYPTTFVR